MWDGDVGTVGRGNADSDDNLMMISCSEPCSAVDSSLMMWLWAQQLKSRPVSPQRQRHPPCMVCAKAKNSFS